jgi:hypothetical protein
MDEEDPEIMLTKATTEFTLIPNTVITDPELHPTAKAVHAVLCYHGLGFRPVTCTLRTLAKETGRSRSACSRALQKLRRKGYVK